MGWIIGEARWTTFVSWRCSSSSRDYLYVDIYPLLPADEVTALSSPALHLLPSHQTLSPPTRQAQVRSVYEPWLRVGSGALLSVLDERFRDRVGVLQTCTPSNLSLKRQQRQSAEKPLVPQAAGHHRSAKSEPVSPPDTRLPTISSVSPSSANSSALVPSFLADCNPPSLFGLLPPLLQVLLQTLVLSLPALASNSTAEHSHLLACPAVLELLTPLAERAEEA